MYPLLPHEIRATAENKTGGEEESCPRRLKIMKEKEWTMSKKK